jgi:hypothetical protein
MIKKSFTSRGYTYHLLDHIQFGDLYFERAETFSSEYLLDCLNAGGVLRVCKEDEFYFYLSPTITLDELESEILLHLLEDFTEDQDSNLLTAQLITDNLWILHTRKLKTANSI